jgi:hypothetical protein
VTVPRLIQIYDCIELLPTRRISFQKANKKIIRLPEEHVIPSLMESSENDKETDKVRTPPHYFPKPYIKDLEELRKIHGTSHLKSVQAGPQSESPVQKKIRDKHNEQNDNENNENSYPFPWSLPYRHHSDSDI